MIGVIAPAHNEQRLLGECLTSLKTAADKAAADGANLGISAKAYARAGGFQPMAAHEDVQIVAALEASGASIVWTARNCVSTSSRQNGRVTGGFADFITALSTTTSLLAGV